MSVGSESSSSTASNDTRGSPPIMTSNNPRSTRRNSSTPSQVAPLSAPTRSRSKSSATSSRVEGGRKGGEISPELFEVAESEPTENNEDEDMEEGEGEGEEEEADGNDTRHASSSLSDQSSKSPTPPWHAIRRRSPSSSAAAPLAVSSTATAIPSPTTSNLKTFSVEIPAPSSASRSSSKTVARPRINSLTNDTDTNGSSAVRVSRESSTSSLVSSPSESPDFSSESDSDAIPLNIPQTEVTKPTRGRGRPRGTASKRSSAGKPRSTHNNNNAAFNAAAIASGSVPPPMSARAKIRAKKAAALLANPPPPVGAASSSSRATRATVTLPPGYIEGVKSTRTPRNRDDSATPAPTPPTEEVAPLVVPIVMDEDIKPVTPTAAAKKGKAREKDKGKDREPPPEPERAPSKRRKFEDPLAAVRAAERTATKNAFIQQLEGEAQRISSGEHPLLEATYTHLAQEKALKLGHLARCLAKQEAEFAMRLEAETEATWRQWADAKDNLRTDLYFENQTQIKQLLYEEKAYPFLRDHPLLVDTRDLPPVPYYRAPASPTAFDGFLPTDLDPYTRLLLPLQPPSLNRAVDHSAWQLTPSEIAADFANFADFELAPPLSPRQQQRQHRQHQQQVYAPPPSIPSTHPYSSYDSPTAIPPPIAVASHQIAQPLPTPLAAAGYPPPSMAIAYPTSNVPVSSFYPNVPPPWMGNYDARTPSASQSQVQATKAPSQQSQPPLQSQSKPPTYPSISKPAPPPQPSSSSSHAYQQPHPQQASRQKPISVPPPNVPMGRSNFESIPRVPAAQQQQPVQKAKVESYSSTPSPATGQQQGTSGSLNATKSLQQRESEKYKWFHQPPPQIGAGTTRTSPSMVHPPQPSAPLPPAASRAPAYNALAAQRPIPKAFSSAAHQQQPPQSRALPSHQQQQSSQTPGGSGSGIQSTAPPASRPPQNPTPKSSTPSTQPPPRQSNPYSLNSARPFTSAWNSSGGAPITTRIGNSPWYPSLGSTLGGNGAVHHHPSPPPISASTPLATGGPPKFAPGPAQSRSPRPGAMSPPSVPPSNAPASTTTNVTGTGTGTGTGTNPTATSQTRPPTPKAYPFWL